MTWQYVVVQIADLYAMILVVYICLTWIPMRQGVFADVMNFLEKNLRTVFEAVSQTHSAYWGND